jgi:hypothetical protein
MANSLPAAMIQQCITDFTCTRFIDNVIPYSIAGYT